MTRKLAVLSAGLLLCACSVLEPREDPTRWFVLAPAGEARAAPSPAARLVVVGPLRLPDYLLRPELVRRAGANELQPSRVDRWSEPLDRAVLRVLCLDLAALRPDDRVVAFPAEAGEQPAGSIEVAVTAFEADAAGLARLQGSWRLRGASGAGGPSRDFRLERAAESGEAPAVVGAMSGLIEELAKELATALGGGAR